MIPPLSEFRFKLGDEIYHKTDGDAPGIVTGLVIRPGIIMYEVTWQGRIVEIHFDMELTTERPKHSASEPTEV